MSKRPQTSQCSSQDTLRKFLKLPRALSRRSPSPTPPGLLEPESAVFQPAHVHQPHHSSGPSTSGGASSDVPADGVQAQPHSSPAGGANPADVNHFNNILNGKADPPRTLAQDLPGITYEGLKGIIAMADTVGYAVPPMKAATAGASRVMTVIDVCLSAGADCARLTHDTESQTE
jgi:hypothetical protein